jgi:hypothetical protein
MRDHDWDALNEISRQQDISRHQAEARHQAEELEKLTYSDGTPMPEELSQIFRDQAKINAEELTETNLTPKLMEALKMSRRTADYLYYAQLKKYAAEHADARLILEWTQNYMLSLEKIAQLIAYWTPGPVSAHAGYRKLTPEQLGFLKKEFA